MIRRVRRQLQAHGQALFQNSKDPIPWARMLICGSATGLPLVIGALWGHLDAAIFAALVGYFISLNDHLGTLGHRLFVATLSFAALATMFVIGVWMHGQMVPYLLTTLILVYWLGLMGGLGAEAERLLLFVAVTLIVVFHQPLIPPEHRLTLLQLGFVGYGVVIAGMFASSIYLRGRNESFVTLRSSVLASLTLNLEKHLYAIAFSVSTFLAIMAEEVYHLERGYWTVITVMLVLRPDHKESIYRVIQRFLGTMIGVLVAEILLLTVQSVWLLIAGVTISALILPYAMKRNYWLVSFWTSIVVVFLLSLPHVGHPDLHLGFTRFEATLYGCLISLFGVGLYRALKYVFVKSVTSEAA